ncbi:MAG: DUF503 domain-containing protein [Candidatus Omnitrophota bacterium]|jgi:uncharacterized protein YlxP (DUF503 family)
MNVGILQVELLISDGNSLKDKRRVLNRIKDRVKKSFNASIAEIGHMDKWRRAVLGVAVISNGKKNLSAHLDNIMNFIGGDRRVTIIDYTVEVI